MSATATPSDRLAVRAAWAPRWLVVTHRYLGVALGLLMLLWCLSGAVMLFVPYPSVAEADRLATLAKIDWGRCCQVGTPTDERVRAASVEQLGARPVLRLATASSERRMIDLSSGAAIAKVGRDEALAVSSAWGRPARADPVAYDQWTVSGEFNGGRPFWRVRLEGGDDVYVSRTSGEVVQRTTAASRLLNWFGAVPHWLYPTLLRHDTKLWTQVVIWTSLAGVFLTVAGLYLGVVAWRRSRDGRLSPFRGLMTWHHLSGLAAGVLTLTWVASGLISMNPWGLLESTGGEAAARLRGEPPRLEAVSRALAALAVAHPDAAQAKLASWDGRVFLMAGDARFDADGTPAPLTTAELAAAGRRLGAVETQGLLTREDAYYFAHHEPVRLPAWRILLKDGRRLYLDPRSGAVLADIDGAARGYRWLHQGLHRFDVVPGHRIGAGWTAGVLLLLAAATLGVATGVWLGLKRLGHDFARFRPSHRTP